MYCTWVYSFCSNFDITFFATESDRPSFSETTPSKRAKTSSVEPPRHFFLHLLLRHPSNLWEAPLESGSGGSQWERCAEYFQFRCELVHGLRGKSMHCVHACYLEVYSMYMYNCLDMQLCVSVSIYMCVQYICICVQLYNYMTYLIFRGHLFLLMKEILFFACSEWQELRYVYTTCTCSLVNSTMDLSVLMNALKSFMIMFASSQCLSKRLYRWMSIAW